MPIYEYACEACETKFEKLVRRATDEVTCPSCQSPNIAQQWSTFAARGNGMSRDATPMGGGCPAGMCGTPGMCGRN